MLWRVQSSDATICERVRRGWHGASASQHFWFAQGQGQPYTVAVHMWCARSQGGHQLTLPRRVETTVAARAVLCCHLKLTRFCGRDATSSWQLVEQCPKLKEDDAC